MSTVKSIIPWMNGIMKDMEASAEIINNYLVDNELSPVQIAESIRIIKQQINTAQNKFTMAFVGEFNSGKSTIINTLLNLDEIEKLSCKDSPDTAKSTRILYKTDDIDYDAEIVYRPGTYENEKMDWQSAKKFTSHVAISESPELMDKVAQIDEVRYYIKKDILTVCNILDLPGTGTGTHREDTELTQNKIYEADVVFWVVSTSSEADKNAVANLERISSKIVPLINVWEFEKDEIQGEFTPEQTLKSITDKYSEYFNTNEEVIIYYGKEIEYALQNGLEIKDEWGKEQFSNCLERIVYSESIDLEREKMNRIKKNVIEALKGAMKIMEEKQESLTEIKTSISYIESEIDVLETSLYSTYQSVDAKIKDVAKNTTNKIVDYLIGITDAYIEDEMQSANIQLLIKSIGRDRKEKLRQEMYEKYRSEYLKLEEKPCWYDDIMEDYAEDVKTLLNGEYAQFKIKAKELIDKNDDLNISDDFISSIIQQSMNAFLEAMGSLIVTIISTVILTLIPGGEIVDSISISLLGKSTFGTDRITKKKENIKNRAGLSINIQRNGIAHQICGAGQDVNRDCKRKIEEIIFERRNESGRKIDSYNNANANITEFVNLINDYISETENY